MKHWAVATNHQTTVETTQGLADALLRQRGIKQKDAASFFAPSFQRDFHDPYLLVDMEKAVGRIFRAVHEKEQIIIWGDYDADGVSSTAILVLALKQIGAQVVPFIPHRHEGGYGLHLPTLKELLPQFNLLIAVDCGISNTSEIEYLKAQKRDAIIVDHHAWPTVAPAAFAILHPAHPDGHYPFPYLCGAGMAWKLATALLTHNESPVENGSAASASLLDLVCLGTIGDVVPLLGENRALVKFGLSIMTHSPRAAISVLKSLWESKGSLTVHTVSHHIAPLLNAAGRMDHAQPALDLLLANNMLEAQRYFNVLRQLNNRRRTVSQQIQQAAEKLLPSTPSPIIFAAHRDWPSGVVGLVAGRLSEKYHCPAFVIGSSGNMATGSARSISPVNVMTMIKASHSHLIKFGGHARAAGFSLEFNQLAAFKESLEQTATDYIKEGSTSPNEGQADAVISQTMLNWDLIDMLHDMEPFGEGNPEPQFILRDLYLGDWRLVGKDRQHVKFFFRSADNNLLPGIGFGLADQVQSANLSRGANVDVLGKLTVDEYRHNHSLQLEIKDISQTGEVDIIYGKNI